EVTGNKLSTAEMIEHIVPKSFLEAGANNDVLQVVFFSVLFGIALAQISGKHRETVTAVCEGLSEVMFKFTSMVMRFAPFGVAAGLAQTISHSGMAALVSLGKLLLTLYGALAAFFLLVFLPIMYFAKIPIRRFWLAVREPAAIAFSTTSSDAALPD